MHAISVGEHNALLLEQGWKEEDFEVGFHKDIAASHFQQYAALVKSELSKGEVRSHDDSTSYRRLSFCVLRYAVLLRLPCLAWPGLAFPDLALPCLDSANPVPILGRFSVQGAKLPLTPTSQLSPQVTRTRFPATIVGTWVLSLSLAALGWLDRWSQRQGRTSATSAQGLTSTPRTTCSPSKSR